MKKFLLVLRGSYAEWKAISPTEVEAIMARYNAWSTKLRAEGRLVEANALSETTRKIVPDGRVIDGPYAETKEALTGFFLLKAKDLEEATEIARGCPALSHGDTVEVAQVQFE